DDDIEVCRIADREISDLVHELNNKINIMLSDISHNNENVERLKTELENNNLSIKNLDDNIIKNKAELETLRSQNSAIDASLLELGETSRMAGSQASEKSSEVENLRSEIIIKTSKINTLKGNIENSKVLLENFTSRHDTINRELHDKSTNFDTLSMQCETLKENLSQNEKAGSALKEKILNAKNIHAEKSERYQNSLTEKNNLSLKLSQDSSKRKMLIDMENGFEGFAKGVKCVMTAYKSGNIKNANIHGPLSQLITTDKTYITAIETALGAASQNVVTQNESDAKTAINYLKERKLGRATFLPISAIKGKSFRSDTAESYDGFISIADKLVRCDGQYDNIVSSVLGTTVIVDTLDNAVKMAKGTGQKFRIVTLGGDVIQAGGAMTGGSAIRTAGSLSRSSEIESLGDEISKNEKNLLVIQEQISALITELNNIAETIKTDRDVLLSYNDDNIKMRSDMEHFQTMIKDLTENREHLELELSEMVSKIDHLNIDITSKTAEIELESTQINELDARITLEQKIFTELAGKNEELTTTLTNLSIRKNSVIKDIELQNERICRINDEKSTLANGLLQKNSEIETLKQKNIELDKQIVLTQNDVSASSVNSDQYKDKLEKVSHLKQKTETKIREKQSSIKEIQENMFTLSQRQTKLESRKSKNEVELENLVTHMWDDYELTYSEALKIKKDDDFDYTDASKRIKQIKDAIRNLGNINVDSIEEYKNVSERFEFLSIQTNDLKKAKIELEKIIGEMLTIMQSKFGEQFKIINENFNIVFAEMFGGGRANLTMTDPSNILESGIEIEAQPPGKKLQSLTLLSGGERAFTAIALLFAILNVRPTPFCILDEIEAALDDVNVYRYADYLKKYSDKTQFIVVTHRRGTMECANVLYGVTMQERGISKLLSLNIDEVKE
ncbi:MAG: chromosome segregation protein SMC, partial [Oscillospiraceae bacterium]